MTQAVILAGGKGTRLASRLNNLPKPLVSIGGVPLLERQIVLLAAQGVDEAIVLVNHEAGQIRSFLGSRDLGCRAIVIDDGEPKGTAGALLACLDHLQETFFLVYGDTMFDIDIGAMMHAHRDARAGATLLLHPNDHPADSDLVELNESGQIIRFHSYPHPPGAYLPNLVNAAFYVIERSLLERHASVPAPADFVRDLFPAALRSGERLWGYRSYEYIKDIGTPERLDKVERQLSRGVIERARRSVPQRAVFVDRDGTLNRLTDYVRRAEDLELLPGVGQAVRRLNDAEWRVVVITNQPVIARGECGFDDMRRIHAKLDTELGLYGAHLDAVYLCPHHPDRGWPGEVEALKIRCGCRKPMPGLIERAIRDLNIDRSQSYFVGDSVRDIGAAENANVRSILVLTGEATHCGSAQAVAADFSAAVDLILQTGGRSNASPVDSVKGSSENADSDHRPLLVHSAL